jgi:mono/diheme cytochrome c family protein
MRALPQLAAILFALCQAPLLSCASLTPAAPTEADARRAATQWPGVTIAQLQEGRSLYLSRCSGCHQPLDPSQIRPDDWPHKVAEMRDRAHLKPDEESLIVRYLMTVASRPLPGAMAKRENQVYREKAEEHE